MEFQYSNCSICGNSYTIEAYSMNKEISRIMRDNKICFNCAFCINAIEHKPQHSALINGTLFRCQEFTGKNIGCTYNHENFRLVHRLSDGAAVIIKIIEPIVYLPEPLKDVYHDEYKFISKDIYNKIKEYEAPYCKDKGCFDRYHCYFYHKEQTEKEGAWNQVPQSHIIGDEECVSFINKFNMYDLH